MNIYEVQQATHISLKNLRKLESLKLIKFDALNEKIPKALGKLKYDNRLSVNDTITFLSDKSLMDCLRVEYPKKWAKAKEQLDALGDVEKSCAPYRIGMELMPAAKGDRAAMSAIADWLASILPETPVSHPWVAVRLAWRLDEPRRTEAVRVAPMAMAKIRTLEKFKPYWFMEKINGKNETRYFSLDL